MHHPEIDVSNAYRLPAELADLPERMPGGQFAQLAAAVAQRARDVRGPAVAFQFLVYPVIDDRLATPSMRAFVDCPVFNPADAGHMWKLYLGGMRGRVSPHAAPGRAADLRNLPPAYVMTAEYDPLRDEAIDYATGMMRAGVSVELHNVARAVHSFDLLGAGPLAAFAIEAQLDALRRGLM